MNECGQIVIQKAARNHFDFCNGQKLILTNDNNEGFILIPAEIFVQKFKLIN